MRAIGRVEVAFGLIFLAVTANLLWTELAAGRASLTETAASMAAIFAVIVSYHVVRRREALSWWAANVALRGAEMFKRRDAYRFCGGVGDPTGHGLTSELRKSAPNVVVSKRGFTVYVNFRGGIRYVDERGSFRVDSELLVGPVNAAVYRDSGDLIHLQRDRANEIVRNIVDALMFLGYNVDVQW